MSGSGEHHSDTTAKLVHQANNIAQYFAAQPGGTASLGTADHIKSFWTPNMLRDIYKHLDATSGTGLSPVALEAVRILKARPSHRKLQVVLESVGGHSRMEPGDDAG